MLQKKKHLYSTGLISIYEHPQSGQHPDILKLKASNWINNNEALSRIKILAKLPAGCSPIVEMKVVLKASSENRNNTHVFPTPESPINNNLNR